MERFESLRYRTAKGFELFKWRNTFYSWYVETYIFQNFLCSNSCNLYQRKENSAVITYNPVSIVHSILAVFLPHTFLFPFAIVIGTFILEDLTTILVGVLAAAGLVDIFVAVAALYVGVILGDCGLYALGRLAHTHPRIRNFLMHERLLRARKGLETNLRQAVITTRFIPGLRLPIYLACGFFKMSFREFAQSAILAALIWTTGLFGLSYFFGHATESWLGPWRWSIAIVIALVIFLVGRYRSRKIF
ncbi:MAG: DedA family protein [Minisyncoccia bacterium]